MRARHAVILGLVGVAASTSLVAATPRPLNRVDVYALLAARVLDVSAAQMVRRHGMSFAPTEEELLRFRAAGAEEGFVKALEDLAPVGETKPRPVSTSEEAALIAHLESIAQLTRKGSKKALEGAEKECRSALKMVPANSRLHFLHGYLLERRDRWREAGEEYNQSLHLDPENAPALVGLGSVLEQTGKPAEAIPQFQRALQLVPEYVEAHLGLGSASFRLGYRHLGVTQAEYTEARRLAPHEATVHVHICILFQGMNDLTDAERSCRRALEIDPSNAEAHTVYGALLSRQHRMAESLHEFRLAIHLNPFSAQAHYGLGGVLEAEDCTPEAAAEYRLAYRLNPFDPVIRNNMRRRAVFFSTDNAHCGASLGSMPE